MNLEAKAICWKTNADILSPPTGDTYVVMAEFFDWQTRRETFIARIDTQCPLSTIEMILLEKYHMINIDNLNEAEEKKVVAPYRSEGKEKGNCSLNASC